MAQQSNPTQGDLLGSVHPETLPNLKYVGWASVFLPPFKAKEGGQPKHVAHPTF
jgi:hypothetical protein